jgi:hypothetical protein
MIQIPVHVAGDQWFNRKSVCEQLKQSRDTTIELDLGAEGPSLARLGIVDAVLEAGIDPAAVTVCNWSNSVENIPFHRTLHHHRASHFFWHHQLHSIADDFANTTDTIFGLFVGRRTFSRCKILYELWNQYRQVSCLSLMDSVTGLPWHTSTQVSVEQFDDWVNDLEKDDFLHWWNTPPVASLDNVNINDQYSSQHDTNRSLLKFYNQFSVEIVCETYCYGDCFFPTEKTIRPIAAGKPLVVFGPVDFLKRLRLLGFETYNKFWDESYDELEGVARWAAMQQVLSYIQQQHSSDWINSVNTVAEHNRQVLKSVVTKYQPT